MSRSRFLLDTDVLTDLVKRAPADHVLDFWETQRPWLSTASVAWFEAMRGALAGGARGRVFFLQNLAESGFPIWPYTLEASSWQAHQSLRLREPLTFLDAFIAATAWAHGLTLVTRNGKDFRRFEPGGLQLLVL